MPPQQTRMMLNFIQNIYPCPHRLVELSPLIQETSLCIRQKSLQQTSTGQNTENNYSWGAQPQGIRLQYNSSTKGSGNIMEDREQRW